MTRCPTLLRLLASAGFALLAARPSHAQGVPCFHPITLGINGEINGEHVALIRRAHAGWMRITVRWASVEPEPGSFDFADLDGLVDRAEAEGVQVLALLSTAPLWAGSNPNGTRPPAAIALWEDFVATVAGRYRGRIAAYEVWNEPNFRDLGLGVGWDADLEDFPRYIDYLRSAAAAIQATAPGTLVVAPSASSRLDDRTLTLYDQLAGRFADGEPVAASLDAVSFHANALDNELASEVEARFNEHLAALAARGGALAGKAVWVTELGWKSNRVGEGSQRDRIRTLLTRWSGRCAPAEPSHAFLFQLFDQPGSESRGLFRSDGSAKPVVRSYLATLPYPAATVDLAALPFHFACHEGTCFFEAARWLDNPFATALCHWQFDDGTGGETCRIRHIFRTAGRRTVALRVEIDGEEVYQQEAVLEPAVSCFDPEPPRARITSPARAMDVRGEVPLGVDVGDNLRLARVDLLADGAVIASVENFPLDFRWPSDRFATGLHRLEIEAVDACGNRTRSAPLELFTDRRAPVVELVSPGAGSLVQGPVEIIAAASDNRALDRVELWMDRRLWTTDREAPFTFRWNSLLVAPRAHRLELRAYDRAGNQAVTPTFTLTPDNQPPRLQLLSPRHGERLSGLVRLAGWSFDASGVAELRCELDGVPLRLAGPLATVARPELCRQLAPAADPRCPAVGFRGHLDASELEAGPHRLRVTARDAAGLATTVEIEIVAGDG